MKKQFESKEHYLNFRKAWASAVTDKRAKTTLHKNYHHVPYGQKEEVLSCDRRKGWITGAHHVVFNMLRERPIDYGFNTTQKPERIANGHLWESGIFVATSKLNGLIKTVKYLQDHPDRDGEWQKRDLATFLEPFNGTVTMEMLGKLDIADTKQYITPPPITPVERFVA